MKRVCVFLLCALSWAAAANERIAVLRQITGDVSVRHGEQWMAVPRAPVDLFDGDKVVTKRGRAEVLYPSDGSLLTLDVGSNMTVHQAAGSRGGWLRRVEVFVGDVFFHISKTAETHNRWQLSTPTAIGGVVGTEGQIHVEGEQESSFSLAEGTLEVSRVGPNGEALGDGSVRIGAGEGIHATRGQPLHQLKIASLPKPPRLDVRAEELPEPKGGEVRQSERPKEEGKGEKNPKHEKPNKPARPHRRIRG